MNASQVIVACEVFRPELHYILGSGINNCYFLPQGLHRRPDVLNRTLQGIIDGLEACYTARNIFIAYGLCGNGLNGLRCRRATLAALHSEDCISVLHGLKALSEPSMIDRTGTYYLSPGWLRYGNDALKEYHRCLSFVDQPTAREIVREMLKSYHTVTFIDTGIPHCKSERRHAREVATFLGLAYKEISGSTDWLAKSIPKADGAGFITVQPGRPFRTQMFLNSLPCPGREP